MKLISLVMLALVSACGFEVVDTGNRGMLVRFGEVSDTVLPEGLHFYNPFTQSVTEFSVREEKIENKTQAFTKDTQVVDISYAATYYADPTKVVFLYKQFGSDWAEKLVSPAIIASMKDSIGQVIADDLVSKREQVTKAAETYIKHTLAQRGISVTSVLFTNLDFDDAYEKAVEAKVVAVQQAATAVNKTVQIQEEAKQTIATAEAEAKAMRIKSEALAQNKGLVQFEAVKRWNGVAPHIMMGTGNFIPFMDMKDLVNTK